LISRIDIELLDNGYGSVVIPQQLAKLYQATYSVDGSILIKGAATYGKYFPKIAISSFMDELTTPNSGVRNQHLDARLWGSDHACEETKPLLSEYQHRRQRLYPLSQLRMRHQV